MKLIYETERLIIRQWEEKDYADLFEFASDPNVTKYLHYPTYTNENTAKERIAFLIEKYETGGIAQEYAIELKDSNKVIGSINIGSYTKTAGGTIRFGYTLNTKFQGKGYMTEAVKGLFKYIQKNNLAKRIEATHDVSNEKSGNVLKRVGMTLEGVMRKAGENNFHTRYDVALYSILDEELNKKI